MKYDEVVVEGRYWWQPERDSVTGALPLKQKVTVVRKTGIAAGEAQDYTTDPLRGPTRENYRIEIETEDGKREHAKAKELEAVEEEDEV